MRYKRVKVSGIFLVNLMRPGIIHAKCIQGLPDGTKFCYSIPDTTFGIWIVIEHESFPILEDGDIIPEYGEIVFEKG